MGHRPAPPLQAHALPGAGSRPPAFASPSASLRLQSSNSAPPHALAPPYGRSPEVPFPRVGLRLADAPLPSETPAFDASPRRDPMEPPASPPHQLRRLAPAPERRWARPPAAPPPPFQAPSWPSAKRNRPL